MPKPPIQDFDLRQLVEENSRLFHLKVGKYYVALQIRRIGPDYLYVDAHPALRRKNLEGYIIAGKGKGLLNFQFRLEGNEPLSTENRFDIVELKALPHTLEYLNKREFRRLDFSLPQSCRIKLSPQNQPLSVRLRDLSASGIGFSSEERIPAGQIGLFSTDLPVLGAEPFEFAVKIIYGITDSENPLSFRYGAKFLLDKDETPLPTLKISLQKKIVQYVNRELIRRKKITEEEE